MFQEAMATLMTRVTQLKETLQLKEQEHECLQNELAEVKQRNVELEEACRDLEHKMTQQRNTQQAKIDKLQMVLNTRDLEVQKYFECWRKDNYHDD